MTTDCICSKVSRLSPVDEDRKEKGLDGLGKFVGDDDVLLVDSGPRREDDADVAYITNHIKTTKGTIALHKNARIDRFGERFHWRFIGDRSTLINSSSRL